MFRRFLLFLAPLAPLALAGQPVTVADLPLAAAPGSTAPQIASAYDRSLYVSWIEPTEAGKHSLLLAQFDRESQNWSEPRQIASGADWFINDADTPRIAAGLRGKVAAVWYVRNSPDSHAYHAMISTSEDHGTTWSAPRKLSAESDATEFVSLASLINGKWLAVWLDGRARGEDHAGDTQLYSRIVGSEDPDTLIDERVCDCCPVSSLVLPNGAVLTAYRDRSANEVRDIVYQRYSRGQWSPASAPRSDGWHIEGCPVNGAWLSRRGAHVATTWFTAAGNNPRIVTARSNNIGNSWNLLAEISDPENPPLGAVSNVVLRDGSQWSSWVESGGTIALRNVTGAGEVGSLERFDGTLRTTGHPLLTVLDNRADQSSKLLMVRTIPGTDAAPGRVATQVVTLPHDPKAGIDDCGCGPGEVTRGHAVRGRIEGILPDRNALLVAHEEVPGVMRAMTMMFQVDPRIIPLVKEGEEILGRMERRGDGKWWLFNLRTVRPTR